MLNLAFMGFSMIDQELINRIKSRLDADWEVETELVCSLLDSYVNLIEQNAELHKELALYKGGLEYVADRVPVVDWEGDL